MRADNFDIEDIVQHLQGTCTNTIESSFGENGILNDDFTPKYPNMTEDDLTQEDYNYIDNFIFLCESCVWWCETSEADEEIESTCQDCGEEER